VSYAVDAAGNLTSDGLRTFEYDAANRLSKARIFRDGEEASIRYLHNAVGQRVFKGEPTASQTLPSEADLGTSFIDWLKKNFRWLYANAQANTSIGTAYVYGDGEIPNWALLGEYDNGSAKGAGRSEFIWLPTEDGSAIPIGMFRNGKLFAIHTDHLGTPRLMTDEANKPVWQWPYSAFGNNKPTGILKAAPNPRAALTNVPELLKATAAMEMTLRFPGQEEDLELAMRQNFHRIFRQSEGRYGQSDPAGRSGGVNRYLYAEANPLRHTDPLGLWSFDVGGFWGPGMNFTLGYDTSARRGFFSAQFGYGVGGGFLWSPNGGLPSGQAPLTECNGDQVFVDIFGKATASGMGANVDVVTANAGYGMTTNRPYSGLSWFDFSFGNKWGLKAEAAGGVQFTATTRPNSDERCTCAKK
jgi:RHS repeat-associated protein